MSSENKVAAGAVTTDKASLRRSGHPTVGAIRMTPKAFQQYLLKLSPARAFVAFTAALASGMLLIVGDYAPTWTPLLPVLAYGAMLAYAQKSFFVHLDGTLKDSPYFLGFILTLFALFDIFTQMSTTSPGEFPIPLIVGKAGGAILPTVVGLFMRQVLLSLDPGEEVRNTIFQSLAAEIRERTVEFHRTQESFVRLVREFTDVREKMFSREEKAFNRYVERMEAGGTILGRIEQVYPARIEQLLDSVERARTRLDETNDALEQQMQSWGKAVDSRIAAVAEEHEATLRSYSAGLLAARSSIEAQLSAVVEGLGTLSTVTGHHAGEIDTALGRYSEAAESASGSLKGIATDASSASQELLMLGNTARESGAALTQSTTEAGDQLRTVLVERIKATHEDLEAIDAIIDELAQVLRKRLTSRDPET